MKLKWKVGLALGVAALAAGLYVVEKRRLAASAKAEAQSQQVDRNALYDLVNQAVASVTGNTAADLLAMFQSGAAKADAAISSAIGNANAAAASAQSQASQAATAAASANSAAASANAAAVPAPNPYAWSNWYSVGDGGGGA